MKDDRMKNFLLLGIHREESSTASPRLQLPFRKLTINSDNNTHASTLMTRSPPTTLPKPLQPLGVLHVVMFPST